MIGKLLVEEKLIGVEGFSSGTARAVKLFSIAKHRDINAELTAFVSYKEEDPVKILEENLCSFQISSL